MIKLWIIHESLCHFMCGLIWLVQLVHYPSFHYVDEEKFVDFCQFHQSRISFIVMPIMILELITAILMVFPHSSKYTIINLIFNILIFLSTFFLSVPLHQKLLQGKDKNLINKLVLTNWPRTILWTLRSVMLFFFFRSVV